MADIGRVRIRIPSSIKAGEVIKVRVLVMHPMEIVERKDGKPVDKNYLFINRVIVTYLGREVAQFETSQSVSENPFFSFAVRATEPGPLKVTFLDTHGGKYEGTADIKLSWDEALEVQEHNEPALARYGRLGFGDGRYEPQAGRVLVREKKL